jgi:hypothetical protein
MKVRRASPRLLAFLCVFLGCAALEGQSEWRRITPVAGGHQMPQSNDLDPSAQVSATRLIFEYDGDNVRLVTQQPVEVAAATLNLTSTEEPGYFVDVRDAANRTLARVAARHAFSTSVEVFPERHDEPITRTDVPQPKGAFTVLVPTPDGTDHATIVNVAQPRGDVARPAAAAAPQTFDLVSFPINRAR